MKWLAVFLLLATPALAQTKIKCATVPICLPPYSPPIDAMRYYCGTAFWEERPYFRPQGALRFGKWVCCDENASLSMAAVRGGTESPRAVIRSQGSSNTGNCWQDLSVPVSGTMTLKQLPSPSERLATLGADCLKDPACMQLTFDTCMKDATCKSLIGSKMTTVDFDQDGVPGTAGDAYWWGEVIAGRVH